MVRKINGLLEHGNNRKTVLHELTVVIGYVLVIMMVSACLITAGVM